MPIRPQCPLRSKKRKNDDSDEPAARLAAPREMRALSIADLGDAANSPAVNCLEPGGFKDVSLGSRDFIHTNDHASCQHKPNGATYPRPLSAGARLMPTSRTASEIAKRDLALAEATSDYPRGESTPKRR